MCYVLAFVYKLWLSCVWWSLCTPSLTWHVFFGYSSNSHSPSPPSSSNAFSLVSSEQDNPSTSGCRLVCNKVPTLAQLSSASCCKSVGCTPSCYMLLATPPSALLLESSAYQNVTALVRPCHTSDARVSISCTPCSSEQSAKAKTQKELFKTLKELKMNLPPEKRSKGKSSTINTLKYALRCVKQVKGKDPLLNVHIVINKSLLWITA